MINFKEHFENIVLANQIAGKASFPFSDEAKQSQRDRVVEEHNEFLTHYHEYRNLDHTTIDAETLKSNLVKMMDDFCDIFVTYSFLCYMEGVDVIRVIGTYVGYVNRENPLIDLENAKRYLCTGNEWGITGLMSTLSFIQNYPVAIHERCKKFDINEALSLVNENNLSKFIELDHPHLEEIIVDTYKKYDEKGVKIYDIANMGRCVFKAQSDGKYLKPSIFQDVDIYHTVEVV
jgi:hypothetical protein